MVREHIYERFRQLLREKEDTAMGLKKWFYRGGRHKRVARTPDLDTTALQAQSRREFGRLG
jgi:hypothetical protein